MKRHAQSGFTLLELGIVTLIISIITVIGLQQKFSESMDLRGKLGGQQLAKVNAALGQYQVTYFTQLVNNTPIAGVANIYAPTVAELSTLNLGLPAGFINQNIMGGQYLTQVSRIPVACVAPNCDITSLVWLNTPVIRQSTGRVDGQVLGVAAQTVGDDAAYSRATPGTLDGASGWSVANPQGNVVGIIGVRNGFGSSGWGRFLPRDGSLPMTGNLDIGSQSIINLITVALNGACTTTGALARDASGAVMSCQSGTWQPQGSAYWKDPVANVASLPACNAGSAWQTRIVSTPSVGTGPRAYTCNGASWQALAVDDAGNLTVPATLTVGKAQINDVVTEGSACASNGLMARNSAGLILSCQSGSWQNALSATCGGSPIGTMRNYVWNGAYYSFQICRSNGTWQTWQDNVI